MLEIHILSLFPESMRGYLNSSIMQRAQNMGLFRYTLHNLTDWTVRPTRRVDDRPYGGGAGTIIQVEPLYRAITSLQEQYGTMDIIYPCPGGTLLNQEYIESFKKDQSYCIICGHYEGIDARIFELFPIKKISIGSYILSSGELSSLVWIDSMVRLIPGVLSEESLREESFSEGLERKIEYPQYSRPEIFLEKQVPEILLSGDQKKIQAWKHSKLQDL